jgi:chromosome segregation protein
MAPLADDPAAPEGTMFTLDRMEVHGFKSFYGRTLFEFRPGIIGVVGPNGCGKSNIGDAISWVLGDQSPKSLRADRMADVIFNGSDARKPLGMAEVTLRFLGTNGGSEPSEEMLVTRRLYRSGESEYSLNGARCRLKDIQEMLVRSSVGSRLYSVIEQGKVDLILASKPKDRRTLFEEAAGILGYKAKRRVALGKLEATQANLVRIHDILSEVAKQAGSLRRQVGKARRFQRLQETIRARRAVLLRSRLGDLESEEGQAASARRLLADQEAELSSGLARCEAEVESLRRRFEEAEGEARRGRDRLNELDREMDRNRLQLEQSREQGEEARRAIGRWGTEAAGIRLRLGEREERLAGRESLLEEARGALRALELSLLEREEEQRRRAETVDRGEEDSEAARSALLMALDRLAEARSRSERIEEDLRRQSARREELEGEIRASREEQEKRHLELAEMSALASKRGAELEEVQREREKLERVLGAEESALQEIGRRREVLAGTIAQMEERIRSLEEESRGSDHSGKGVAAVLAEAREGKLRIRGRVADGVEVEPRWTLAAEAALREVLPAVAVDEPADAASGIRFLRESFGGRCGFLAVSSGVWAAPSVPAELLSDARCAGRLSDQVRAEGALGAALRQVLERMILAADLEGAIALWRLHPGWSFVTPDGDLVLRDGLIQGGAAEPVEKGVLFRRRSREDLGGKLREALSERDRLDEAGAARDSARRAGTERMATLDGQARVKEREKLEAQLRLDQRRDEWERADRTLDLARRENERLELESRELAAEREHLTEVLSGAESRRRELEERIQAAAGGLASSREAMAAGAETLGEFRSRVAVEREKIRSGEEEITGARETVNEERARLERAEREGKSASELVESLESAVLALQENLLGAQKERGAVAARLDEVEKDVALVKTRLLEGEQEEKAARSALEALRVQISDADVVAARLDVEMKHLESSAREDLGMDLEALRALPAPEGEVASADREREIAELKARLERLGPVNMAALEQFREMEERHGFLAKQKKDLEDSIEALNETIRKINRTSREKFLEAFQRIQEGFDESFKTLFGGGKAELRLLEDEDVLECGIEIIASPPGKRLQSISLLSGGEKALTAVALLFALFRYRPSPFCVLDEVDAPLDEANVGRFTRMLRDLTPETQFILITHNRRSMEAADLLYGITMEEPGISKVVSLRLDN